MDQDMNAFMRARSMHSRFAVLGNRPKNYSDEFYTPPELVQSLGEFDLDPAAGPMSHAKTNIRKPDCGLEHEWFGRVFLNPPYWDIHLWIHKFKAHSNGIILVNARPDALWFQSLCNQAAGMLFLKGRINFIRPDGKKVHPPVGSVLFAYGQENLIALRNSGLAGFLVVPDLGS